MIFLMNVVFFYICWFGCILGAAGQHMQLALMTTIMCVGVHLLLHRRQWTTELKICVMTMLVGSCLDAIVPLLGVVHFASAEPSWFPSYPVWMSFLWLGFGTTLTVSMAWLQRSILLSIVFGFFGGPLSFIAAEKLGALVVTDTYSMQTSLLVIGCVWGVALPLVVQIAARFSAALK
jgi:hypothetical protein